MRPDYQKRTNDALPGAIRAIRLRLRLTGKDFGSLVRRSLVCISEYETGRSTPSTETLLRLLSLAKQRSEREPIIALLKAKGMNLETLRAAIGSGVAETCAHLVGEAGRG